VMDRLAALAPAMPFAPGVRVPIGGVKHRLQPDPDAQGSPFLHRRTLVVPGAVENFRRRTLDFMRAEARRRITARIAPHAAALGVAHGPIRVKDTRSRWGSCAPDGTLAFSWRLVMAPEWVMDYVVAHEVAHLKELNHSPRFWAHLAKLTPHREEAVAWLTKEGPALLRIG
jgi:predicted metal-dependent hydrolase